MRTRWLCLAFALAILASSIEQVPARASNKNLGWPAQFTYGVRLQPDGWNPEGAIGISAAHAVGAISFDINWSSLAPDSTSTADLSSLDAIQKKISQDNILILVSIIHAPSWAMTPRGPDPNASAQFALQIARYFEGNIAAIELFPQANSRQAWGTQPDPAHYLRVWQAVKKALYSSGFNIALPAGGLSAILSQDETWEGIPDTIYLEQLYQAGAFDQMQIISLVYTDVLGDPTTLPNSDSPYCLRRYESIRQVMLRYHQNFASIWITRFPITSGKIMTELSNDNTRDQENKWLVHAYRQVYSQLFIKAIFLDPLNAIVKQGGRSGSSLILSDQSYHPFFDNLQALITYQNLSNGSSNLFSLTQRKNIIKQKPASP